MIRGSLHQSYCQNIDRLKEWYSGRSRDLETPIYSSFDIRDAGFKVANVDANIYPAGFNNICPADKESVIDIFANYLDTHYGPGVERILLVTEEHTNNPFYWENVLTIQSLLESSGRKVLLAVPRRIEKPLVLTSLTGIPAEVVSAYPDSPAYRAFDPQFILSNNDFSEAYEDWARSLTIPMNPPRELGWYQRRKSRYFAFYNELVEEFCSLCGIDPFLLNVKTEVFRRFDLTDEEAMKALASQVDAFIADLRKAYEQHGVKTEPHVFIKNNSGTYGLAVMQARSGAEVLEWNYKARKKMKAAKGGRNVTEVIIQEGIPSRIQSEGATAEPVIYMVGCELAGGFLRAHAEKTSIESLNSPGAVYKRLCVSDLNVALEGAPLENVYGWSARLGLLAIGMEAREMGVQFKNYRKKECSP